jgi:dihydrofolate reductase
MKKIVLYIAQSLDGYIATKDGSVAWLDPYNEQGEVYGEYNYSSFIKNIDTVIQGRVTYDQFHPQYPGKNSYVFTSSPRPPEGGTVFVKGDIKNFIKNLDNHTHQNIWLVGGRKLLKGFLDESLVDEMIIFTMPTLLGEGIPLFENSLIQKKLFLRESKKTENGVVVSHYRNHIDDTI